MPVTMPPKSALGKPKTEAEIEAIINKGGSPMFDVSRKLASPKKGISQQDWLVEAVLEKLQREEGK